MLVQPSQGADAVKQTPPVPGLVPLEIKLPTPMFKGTPKNLQVSPDVEALPEKPRPPLLVPPGLTNLAPGAKLTCSDRSIPRDALARLTDGDKEASDQTVLLLRKGIQHVQLTLGGPSEIFAILIWHSHASPKVYHDVVVQAADDQDFTQNVRTLFNNDKDNSSGLGVGADREYFETHEGKCIDAKGVKARCLRFYSKGSTESALNEYTELEVYGRPVK
jgi:hypothetical protein